MADFETVVCVKNEVFVYKIPARSSNRGYRAAEWKLDQPDWTGRLRICVLGKGVTIKLDDRNTGELFAQCPVDTYPGIAVEQVLDSSRYFVLRIQDGSGRSASIGIGFADRGDSFDLLVALQDHFKRAKREDEQEEHSATQAFDEGPKLDLGFKEGQTIRINIATKRGDCTPAKPRPKAGASGGLLPPPPGGVKVPGPPKPATPSPEHHATKPASQSNTDLLFDLGAPPPLNPMPSVSSQPATDPWGDFTAAGKSGNPAPPPPANSSPWVNFE